MESYGAPGRGRGAEEREEEETPSSRRAADADDYEEDDEEDTLRVKVLKAELKLLEAEMEERVSRAVEEERKKWEKEAAEREAVRAEEVAEVQEESQYKAQQFREQVLKSVRALRCSQAKTKRTFDKLRGVKDVVLHKALQLQVILHTKGQQQRAVQRLQAEVCECRQSLQRAKSRLTHANRIMSGLHREVGRLKALLKAAGVTDTQWSMPVKEGEGEGEAMANLPTMGTRGGMMSSNARDARVRRVLDMHRQRQRQHQHARYDTHNCRYSWEALYVDSTTQAAHSDTPPPLARPLTPFQEWKVGRGLWTPDTPAASLHADYGVKRDYYMQGHKPGIQHNHCSTSHSPQRHPTPTTAVSEEREEGGRVLPWTPKRGQREKGREEVEEHSGQLLFGSCQQVHAAQPSPPKAYPPKSPHTHHKQHPSAF